MVGLLSDIGNVRELNEDYVGCFESEEKSLYVVADGMGGHNAGEVASKIAVESTIEFIKAMDFINDLGKTIEDAVKYANKKIYKQAILKKELIGMGTTITACLKKGEEMAVANVGDSSCYIQKKDGIYKITKDHSLVQELIDSGTITEEEAIKHPNKNIITRALGTSGDVDVDIFLLDLKDVNKILLCTDGLSNMVTCNEIYDIVTKNSNEDSCEKLVELSKLKGGRDNISVVVFEGECEDDGKYAR